MSVVGEAVGLGLAGVGLLAGFKGAVDGYLLIEGMFDKDNGIRDIVLDYRIECEKLKSWGDRFNINAGREEDCLLYNEKPQIKKLMAEIFGLQNPSSSFQKHLHTDGPEAEAMSQAQMYKSQRSRISWVIKNKAKFEEVVRRLRKANEDLLGLLSIPSLETFYRALPGYVLAVMSSQQAVNIGGSSNDLIRQAAQLKLLQSSSGSGGEPTRIISDALLPAENTTNPASSREISIYNQLAPVWVEWFEIERTYSPVEEQHVRERIKTLSKMLESAPSTFRTAQCIGYLEDPANSFRTGMVYSLPTISGGATPMSLLHIIKDYSTNYKLKKKHIYEPPLGEKFKLAQALATTLMQLHACDWLHKGFRSDNILFFTSRDVGANITEPYLAGFEYARDVNMQSIGYRPSGAQPLDYYYHPDVVSGFTKVLDLYSLGVVLLEIAFWRPLGARIPKDRVGSLESIRQVFLDAVGPKLDAEVGTIYADVVRKCLKCDFPNPRFEAEFTKWFKYLALIPHFPFPLSSCTTPERHCNEHDLTKSSSNYNALERHFQNFTERSHFLIQTQAFFSTTMHLTALLITFFATLGLVSGLAYDPYYACNHHFLFFRIKHQGSHCRWKASMDDANGNPDYEHHGRESPPSILLSVTDWPVH
ncbi:hypothetical protein BDV96DRAFT_601492 [Lophiotrema nucula]|uniref:Protein kinase domain-containing protein n=1 Tax=Lophiotrema nucula TaxID=690887 RepID=A0A6A5Z1P6_9PLEO|nr:hypothetical protein BDV96DRAFT_601492 [Lophiotrema nucula]